MSDELRKALDDRGLLRRLAGDKSFARGLDYFSSGAVRSIVEHDGKLAATVAGTEDYEVFLWLEDAELLSDCSCPMGAGGAFCKHCVAVGLSYAAGGEAVDENVGDKSGKAKSSKRKGKGAQTLDDIKTFLESRSKEQLIELLLQSAFADNNLRERLRLEAARSDAANGVDVKAFRDVITRRTGVKGFIEYHEMREFVRGLNEMTEHLRRLLTDDAARECVELCEFALVQVEAAMETVDDSDGYMSGVLDDLQLLHLQACEIAKPDVVDLARRLFAWELRSEWEVFYGAAQEYKDVFGREGLAEYRRLAEEAWAKVAPRHPPNDAVKNKDSFGKGFVGFLDEGKLNEMRGESKRFRISRWSRWRLPKTTWTRKSPSSAAICRTLIRLSESPKSCAKPSAMMKP